MNSVTEHIGPDELLEHPQDAAALLVGEDVEHALGLFRPADRELDRAGRVQPVDGPGRIDVDTEADPPFPLWTVGVHGEDLHERGERLVQPDSVPPLHGDQVAEPHVGDLMADDISDALEFDPGRSRRVD